MFFLRLRFSSYRGNLPRVTKRDVVLQPRRQSGNKLRHITCPKQKQAIHRTQAMIHLVSLNDYRFLSTLVYLKSLQTPGSQSC